MADFVGHFNSEIVRPLVTLILPGAFAITPSIIGILWAFPEARVYCRDHETTCIGAFGIASLFAGMVCEDLGARIESTLDKLQGEGFTTVWHRYLRTAFQIEPVGHKYLRSIVQRMKFELGSAVAAFIGIFSGVLWWPTSCENRFWASMGLVALAGYLLFEATQGHKLLGKLRSELLKGVEVLPSDPRSAEATVGATAG